ncbi:hydrolase, partial [Pseudoalteromonas issachenkonii]
KIYQNYLLDRMKKSMLRKLPQIKQQIPITTDQFMNIDDLLEFDNQLSAPLHGFENAHDFYRKASAMPYL